MAEPVLALANEARRAALVRVLWLHRSRLTLDRLEKLLTSHAYAKELGRITVGELMRASGPDLRGAAAEAAILRVFRDRPSSWISSRTFILTLGLRRWDAQRLLGELAARGLLIRKGTRSTTRYRLAAGEAVDSSGRLA